MLAIAVVTAVLCAGAAASASVGFPAGLSKPTLKAPAVSSSVSRTNSYPISWTGGGGASYDVQVEVGLNGTWTDLLSDTTSTSTTYLGSAGKTCFFRARALDVTGAPGPWSVVAATTTPQDDAWRSCRWSSGWSRSSSWRKTAFLGTLHSSSRKGASLSFSFTGRSLGLIAAKGPKHGKFTVYLDGRKVRVVDTLSSRRADRQLVYSYVWSTSAKHSVKIVVQGTARRPLVELDGIALAQLDTAAPQGSLAIDSGAQYTNSDQVILSLPATDDVSVASMEVSTLSSLSGASWVPYEASCPWTLSGGDGSKTIYARFADDAGHQSAVVSSSITLDTTAPQLSCTTASGTVTPGSSKEIDVQASDADPLSVTLYYRTTGGSAFTSLAFAQGTGSSWQAIIPAGDVTAAGIDYYVEATDAAGNTTLAPAGAPGGGLYELTPPDTTAPPVPTMLIGNAVADGASLSWQPVIAADLSHYNILRSATLAGTYTKIGESTSTSYTDTTALHNRTYYYEVTAEDYSDNISAPCTPVQVVLPAVLSSFGVSAPSAATVGQAFTVTITAYDSNDDVMTSYAGTVELTALGGSGTLAPDSTSSFTNGVASVQATYSAVATIQIKASDGAASGTSSSISLTTQPVLDHIT